MSSLKAERHRAESKIRDKVNSNATDVKYSRLPRKGKLLPNMGLRATLAQTRSMVASYVLSKMHGPDCIKEWKMLTDSEATVVV